MPQPKNAILINAEDYEVAFYSAKNEVFGRHGNEDAPAGVVAMFESTKVHVRTLSQAGKSLQHSASAGSESAKFFLNEHLKAQAISHYRSKEDVHAFYVTAFTQTKGHEQVFVQSSMDHERTRLLHDQNSRILLACNKFSGCIGPSSSQSVVAPKKFMGTKMHEDCKGAIREMVLRNPLEFLYIKSVEKYIRCFCSHELCPIPGVDADEKVG